MRCSAHGRNPVRHFHITLNWYCGDTGMAAHTHTHTDSQSPQISSIHPASHRSRGSDWRKHSLWQVFSEDPPAFGSDLFRSLKSSRGAGLSESCPLAFRPGRQWCRWSPSALSPRETPSPRQCRGGYPRECPSGAAERRSSASCGWWAFLRRSPSCPTPHSTAL